MTSKTFGPETAQRPHLVQDGKGGVAGEVGDLRGDVEVAIEKLELRTSFPELDWMDGATITAAGGDIILEGRNLLQGQTFASLTLWTGTSEVVITALTPGADGNLFTIQITDGATAGSEVVTKTGNAFVVQIEVGVSTADQIATAINANGADSDGYLTANGGGSGTTNAVAAATAMAGGAGEGFTAYVSGVACLPANTTGANGGAAIDNGTATVTVPDLTAETPARAATDVVAVYLVSNGLRSQQLSAALA